MQSMGRSMDWTLQDNMVDGLFFCATLTGRRGGRTQFVQTGAETSDTDAEAVKPDPSSSWEGRSGGVGAGIGDENAESCEVVQPLRIPLVTRSLRCTYVVVVRLTDEMLCSRYKWVFRIEGCPLVQDAGIQSQFAKRQPFNDRAGLHIIRHIFGHNSAASIARELFKPATDSASGLVQFEKKSFFVLGLGFSGGGRRKWGCFCVFLAYFTQP